MCIWATESVGTVWKKVKPLASAGILTPRPPACSLITVLAMLFWHYKIIICAQKYKNKNYQPIANNQDSYKMYSCIMHITHFFQIQNKN
jgi:hypothetical protein